MAAESKPPAAVEVWIDGGIAVTPGRVIDGEVYLSVRQLAIALDWAPVRFMSEMGRLYLWTCGCAGRSR